MKKKIFIAGLLAVTGFLSGNAVPVQIKMNAVSRTMTLAMEDGTPVEVGEPSSRVYSFDVNPGKYILTGYASNGTVNGTIVVNVVDQQEEQEFTIYTHTIYATNKDSNNNLWQYGVDYTAEVDVVSREGEKQIATIGDSATSGRKCIMSFSGNTTYMTLIPSQERIEQGYMNYYAQGTMTANRTMSGEIPMGANYYVELPATANAEIGQKKAHFTEFRIMEPINTTIEGDIKKIHYRLPKNTVLNYRTWKEGGLTRAGQTVPADGYVHKFTEDDYAAFNPHQINHDVTSNQGYETGDIFVNINERNHLVMNVGDTFDAHAMRTWELTDTQTNNYFFEPDFHYTVIDENGNPSTGVIEISTDETTSPWRTIKAVGNGTVIVLVTYDAIGLPAGTMGGQYWGAIWPENTAAYVVTVGDSSTAIKPNMVVNENYNITEDGTQLKKLAGINVDAEHDVFYYLDTENGYDFTFTPEGVTSVTLAYPAIGERSATYTGFGSEGVTTNEDGSYTVRLKFGRNIVKLTDASGKSVYQILNAKPCHREISNVSRPDSKVFYPGDKVKIQYSGLFHPANKLAGIYNMSAYVTYNGTPNGTSLILGPGQYTFGSAPDAQAIQFEIPLFHDVETEPVLNFTDGVIQVNGYGDPIGNHRYINREMGRSANFTAAAHKTYFGSIPEFSLSLSPIDMFKIKLDFNVAGTEAIVKYVDKDIVLTPDEDGYYKGTYGTYSVTVAKQDDYRGFNGTFTIAEGAEGIQVFPVDLVSIYHEPNGWDGKTLTEPAKVDGIYQISNGAELAWLAQQVNNGAENQDAVLTSDIELSNYEWTPIGSRSLNYLGSLDGQGHKITGLLISEGSYVGVFGEAMGATIKNLSAYGEISGEYYVGGIAGYIYYGCKVDNCTNYITVTSTEDAGGIAGFSYQDEISNCINAGNITAPQAGGILSAGNFSNIVNTLNIGSISDEYGGAICPYHIECTFTNAYSNKIYSHEIGETLVTEAQLASGEVAHRLGEAFGQTIGEDQYPVLNGMKVYKVSYTTIADVIAYAEEEETAIYTNGVLPEQVNGQKARWYADEAMTQPVNTVDDDAALYLKLGGSSYIDSIYGDNDTDTRWFNLQGIEVAAPAEGTHGIFIRVNGNNSAKVRL